MDSTATNETASAAPLAQRWCRGCKTPVFGDRIGRPPACPKCRAAEIERRDQRRRERAKHERDCVIDAAHAAVDSAVRRGDLPPPSSVPCEYAGSPMKCRGRRAWHHDNYARPLDVRCLCAVHHSWWHGHHKAVRGDLVKCAANGCRAETNEHKGRWYCPEHRYRPPASEWGAAGGWILRAKCGVAKVTRCRVGFNVTAYQHVGDKTSVSLVRVHTPDELRAAMREAYTFVTGVAL